MRQDETLLHSNVSEKMGGFWLKEPSLLLQREPKGNPMNTATDFRLACVFS
jgi:hypothetical protein